MDNNYPFSFDYPNKHANYITRKGTSLSMRPIRAKEKIVYVDVDEVCAQLHPVWLKHYNKDWDDNLKSEDVTDWAIEKFVKPECGVKIYDYIKNPSIYDEIIPNPGALEGVNRLRELKYRVLFPTSCGEGISGRKFFWLKDWGFIQKIRDYIEISDKGLLLGDYMFDDYYDNAVSFTGYAYLLNKPHNLKQRWYRRVNNWEEFIKKMEDNHKRGM